MVWRYNTQLMRCCILLFIIALISTGSINDVQAALVNPVMITASTAAADEAKFAAGRVLVKMKTDGTSNKTQRTQNTMNALGLSVLTTLDGLDIQVLEVAEGQELETVATLAARADVEFVEPDYLYHTSTMHTQAAVQPNDSLFNQQWGLTAIHAPEAWATTQGDPNVVIAVIDTGVDLVHADMESELVAGTSFARSSRSAQDDNGHGTHVASTAAGATNNQNGVAGVAWQARIMPVKALNSRGAGRTSDIANSIRWAADNGADVINLSLGSAENSETLHDAIRYAYNKEVFIVAAMGNEFTDGNPTNYPAAYAEVFAVGAIDQNSNHAMFSNSGRHIDVVAPGVNILAAVLPDTGADYAFYHGTSMAAPFVSGLAALLRSVDPTLTNQALVNIIQETATDIGALGWDELTGYGRIDAQAAVESLIGAPTPTATPRATPVPTATSTPTAAPTSTAIPTPTATPDLPVTGEDEASILYLPMVSSTRS